eukprot:4091431-Pyramimonas_sp.AAC.2
MDNGYSFYLKNGKLPHLVLPNDVRVDLAVDDKIPHLNVGGGEALGRVDEAASAYPAGLERWACAEANAKSYLADPEQAGGPPLRAVRHRTTLDLHSHDVLTEDSHVDGVLKS